MPSKTLQVIEIIQLMSKYLEDKGIENARLNAELLSGHVLNLDRVQLYLNFEKPVEKDEADQLRELLKRRANHEPVQYILGETEFYSLKFKVNKHTLIPRPETEILIDAILKIHETDFQHKKKTNILDIGAGCGNIPVTLTKNLATVYVTSIDINSDALKTAQKNAEVHGVADRIQFLHQDVFEDNMNSFPQFDLIVANPPYIAEDEFNNLPEEIKKYESHTALFGGKDGLKFYHRIVELAKNKLADQGYMTVEIGAAQGKKVQNLFQAKEIFESVHIEKDYNQRDRVVIAKKIKS